MTDAAGCDAVSTANLDSVGGPTCSISSVDAECGVNTGAAFASANGGSGNFRFLWSTGATTPTITGLAPGNYSVTVTDDKGCQTVCQTVIMTSGENCGEIGNKVWDDANADGIYDPVNEAGIPGITVTIFDADTGLPVATVVTDDEGEYCFTGLLEGDYYVEYDISSMINFIPTVSTGQPGGSDVTGDNGDNTTDVITLAPGQVNKDVDAGFYRGGQIGNTVWCDNELNPGTFDILDASDTRVEGVEVRLYYVDVNTGEQILVATTVTDIEGNYLFNPVPAGNYEVEFMISDDKYFVARNSGQDDTIDSDVVNIVDESGGFRTGRTATFILGPGEMNQTIDAGTTTRVPLAIELLGFDGVWNERDGVSNLFWETSLEINSDYIAVERTRDLSVAFEQIGSREAQGQSSSATSYTFDDTEVYESGIYYYRLRLVDSDGSFAFSKRIAIDVRFDERTTQEIEVGVYPNPVIEKLHIDISVERPSEVKGGLYDAIGQLVQSIDSNGIKGGTSTLSLDVTDIPVGTYLLRVEIDGEVHFEKVSIIE